MRRKELEIVVDLREQLEQKRESEEREESALRSMEAQQRMLQEAEVKPCNGFSVSVILNNYCSNILHILLVQTRVEEFKTALERWQSKFSEAEEVFGQIFFCFMELTRYWANFLLFSGI